MDHPADFLVAADDRIELALRGELGEITAKTFQGLVGRLGMRRGHALMAANLLKRLHKSVAANTELLEQPAGRPAVFRHCQEQVLYGNVFVLELLELIFGLGQQAIEPAREVELIRAAGGTGNPRQTFQLRLGFLLQTLEIHIRFTENRRDESFRVFQKSGQEVLDVDLLMAGADGTLLGVLQGLLRFFREPVDVHGG